MRFSIHLLESRDIQVRVALRGRQSRVSQQLLNRPQVGPGLEQVRRKGMPQRMRADPLGDRRLADIAPDDAIDAAGREASAAEIQKQRIAPPCVAL